MTSRNDGELSGRSRVAPWVIACGAVVSVATVLTVGAWYVVPVIAPVWTMRHSPWAGPVMRTALRIDAYNPDSAYLGLFAWAKGNRDRCEQLVPYLDSQDPLERRMATFALAGLSDLLKSATVDLALRPLLDDPDPELRQAAALAMSDPDGIPTLEAHQGDSDKRVVDAIEATLTRMRATRGLPK
jgi:hypothetical protein